MTPNEPYLPWARPDLGGNEQRYVVDALRSTWISGGPYVERLERDFAALCGSPHALAVSNGTTALHLAYLGLGIGADDEVVVPGFGFLAAANVALHLAARPVFCEVDPRTWCMRAEDVEPVLTSRTKAIVPVHTYGNVCDMDSILGLARERGIAVIEDAAEAFPSRYRGRLAGTLSTVGTYSFQATKTITTGEGGMVVGTEDALCERMALYRSHGLRRKRHYWHEVPGHNFRLTNLQAAMGCAQLERLDDIVAARRRVYAAYRERLGTLPGVELQHFAAEVDPVVWAIAVRLDHRAYPQGRDAVLNELHEAGIESRPGFYAASQLDYHECAKLPVCEALASTIVSLPSFPTLTPAEIDRICSRLQMLGR